MEESDDIEKTASLYASRRLRELRGDLTQEEFGIRIGMKGVTLSSLEVGRTRFTIGRAVAIAKALGVEPSTFIFHDDDGANPSSSIEEPGVVMERKEETQA